MRSRVLAAVLVAATLVVGAVACSLNPQPLPPQDGVAADSGASSPDAAFSEDGRSNFGDASDAVAPPATDAGNDANATDASDAGDANDAATDAPDAADAVTE
jgi:hypothetical protein